MAVELVSVHVPKTGGNSVRVALRSKYGWRVRLIYDHPEPRPKRHVTLMKRLFARAIHGHFPASRFALIDAPMIAFVRDPIELHVSAWHHVQRRYAEVGPIEPVWEAAGTMSLEDFMGYTHPGLSLYLDVPLDRFAFIGDMATFDRDMHVLADRFGLVWNGQRENANPSGSAYQITPQMRRDYERANPAEVDIYRRAVKAPL